MIGLVLALLQAPRLDVAATLDRDRIEVGEEVTLSLRATSAAPGGFRVELPLVNGITVEDRRERTGLVAGAAPARREYSVELRLRATQVGTWRYAPILVFVGDVSEVAPEVTVTVTGAGAADPSTGNPTLLALIQRAPSPAATSGPTLSIVVSSSRVVQGEQLDVLTAAWFPRSLRTRLRRPPTLKPPVLAGVWSVPQPPVPGVLASRQVGDEVYDLFASHQVVFPLTPGRLTIPPARLEYGLPAGRRASGDERVIEAASDPAVLVVGPLPDRDRPAGFSGPVARGLRVGYRLKSLPARVGEPLPVEVTVAGEGNLAFWSPPNVTWPAGSRAYLDHVTDAPRAAAGRLGGVKTFHFLLLADSVGSVALPPLTYSYFDPARGYREAISPGVVVAVLEPTRAGPIRQPPPLAPVQRDWASWIGTLERLPVPWWLLAILPITLAVALRAGRSFARPRPEPAPAARGMATLDRMIVALVPEDERGRPEGIVHGFRHAGVDRETAVELARLKTEVDRLRFAADAGGDPGSLGSRIDRVLDRLPGPVRRSLGIAGLLLVATAAVRGAGVQPESPERHYREGRPKLAAQAFLERARTEPGRWQHWYNLAAARYHAGEDAPAAAALERSLELAPRERLSRALWTELEREHEPLHDVSRAGGLSLSEWRALVIAVAIVAGILLPFGSIPLWTRAVAVGAVLIGAVVVERVAAARREPAGFVQSAVTLRISPHGLAPERTGIPALSRVSIEGARDGWLLVRDVRGSDGWVPEGALVPIGRLD